MNYILLHISGIAILEIIFYFLYIGPYESEMFKKSFGSSIYSLTESKDIPYQIIYSNTSGESDWDNYISELKKDADYNQMLRNENNNTLFVSTLLIWAVAFAGSFVIFLGSFFYNNYHIKKINRYHNNQSNNNIKYNKILYKLFEYLTLGFLIILFEYIFFQYVVLKYKIISNEELRYIIMNKIDIYFANNIIEL